MTATLALVVALGTGGAYAAGLGPNAVKASNIASNAVQARHIANGAVRPGDLADGAVGARAIGDGSVGAAELGADAVGASEVADGAVDGARIEDGSITGADVAPDSISSARMTVGVKNLLFNGGVLAVDRTYADFTVGSGSWPAGAPSSGAQVEATWTQPAETLDVVVALARVEYPAACSATAATPRGFDVKITDGSDRVISASSPQRTDGVSYNGHGFWDQQTALPGVSFRAPNGLDLATDPEAFIDYVHLPIEMAELVTGSSGAERTVRMFFKRSSSTCSPEITDARVLVYRYA
ncbi:hypothetical protein [Nocardioides marinquilinus]|uniref:hypothetical protein n=1 Tax=Nocardioides marinquilinus TaxID=1210400 RepID=UPI0031EB5349